MFGNATIYVSDLDTTVLVGASTPKDIRYTLVGRNSRDKFTNKNLLDPTNKIAADNLNVGGTILPVSGSITNGNILSIQNGTAQFVTPSPANPDPVITNTISERTAGSGVTIDGVVVKDGGATLLDSTTAIRNSAGSFVRISNAGDTGTELIIQVEPSGNPKTVILPDADLTLVGTNTTQTFESKTINSAQNTIQLNGININTVINPNKYLNFHYSAVNGVGTNTTNNIEARVRFDTNLGSTLYPSDVGYNFGQFGFTPSEGIFTFNVAGVYCISYVSYFTGIAGQAGARSSRIKLNETPYTYGGNFLMSTAGSTPSVSGTHTLYLAQGDTIEIMVRQASGANNIGIGGGGLISIVRLV
jgi:hypothetical protein